MNEQLIIQFRLESLKHLEMIELISNQIFHKTGWKADIQILGSKGYLSHIIFSCEGNNPDDDSNILWLSKYGTSVKKLQEKTIRLFHSHENGIRIEVESPAELELISKSR